MAASPLVVTFEVVSLDHGVWCDACALSSAARLTFTVTSGGVTKIGGRVVCEQESTHDRPR